MRAAAQVDEIAMLIESEFLAALRDAVNEFLLELVVAAVNGFVARVEFVG